MLRPVFTRRTRGVSRAFTNRFAKGGAGHRRRMRARPLALESLETRALLAVDWVSQGPSPSQNGQVENITNKEVVGSVHTVLAHPTNPNVLYIGASNGGIWKTENATAASPSWVPLTDSMPSLSIGALALDPTDASRQTLVAGIGLYSSWMRLGGSRAGLLRTTDGGAAWSVINGGGTLVGKNISGVAARGDTFVVSVNTADSFITSNLGIFRSTNGGGTFTRISDGGSSGLPAGWSYDLASDPTNNAILYTSIVSSGTGNGVYKSTDTGATWTKVSSSAIDALITSQVSNLEITVGNHNNVYVGIVRNGNPVGFFRSGDGGGSWAQMDAPKTNENGTDVGLNPRGVKGPGPGSEPADIAGGQGTMHVSLVADPDNPNLVYVGGDRQPRSHGDTGSFPNSIGANDYSGRLFRGDASAVSGSQWVHLTHSSSLGAAGGGTAGSSAPHADSRDMTFDAAGNIIEVDDGGVYRRTSPKTNTGNWFSVNGSLRVTEIHDVAYDPISNILMSGNQDTGTTEQIVSGGAAWRSVSTGDGGDVSVDSVTLAASGRSIRYSSFQY
ncbi:MAG: WD40/YVTN/BNR-like repeat-containing protein, partial [Planctomycetia bacterium]